MNIVYKTDVGKVREHNEDNVDVFISRKGTYLVVVADGMGGHQAGEVASQMVIEKLKVDWETNNDDFSPETAKNWLQQHIQKINREVYEYAQERIHCQGMGTTVICALCGWQFVTIAHIGDSRCYLLSGTDFNQITEDHSFVNELVKSGQISKEDAEHHPRKNVITRSLGTEPTVKVDIHSLSVDNGDVLLICSDGLSNKIETEQLKQMLIERNSLQQTSEALIKLANDRGGEDNITVALIEFVQSESR